MSRVLFLTSQEMARVILGSRPAKFIEQSRALSCSMLREECANPLAFESLLPTDSKSFSSFSFCLSRTGNQSRIGWFGFGALGFWVRVGSVRIGIAVYYGLGCGA